VDNAIKHTPADGSVTVSASNDAAGVTLAVEDSGRHFTRGFAHIFELLSRVRPAKAATASDLAFPSHRLSPIRKHHLLSNKPAPVRAFPLPLKS
jgi:hypothetical protein